MSQEPTLRIIMLLKRPSSVCDARCDATVIILNISKKMEWLEILSGDVISIASQFMQSLDTGTNYEGEM